VAKWLSEEDFEVKTFVDNPDPATHTKIRTAALFDEVAALVRRGTSAGCCPTRRTIRTRRSASP
jgi:hypothetical protein